MIKGMVNMKKSEAIKMYGDDVQGVWGITNVASLVLNNIDPWNEKALVSLNVMDNKPTFFYVRIYENQKTAYINVMGTRYRFDECMAYR